MPLRVADDEVRIKALLKEENLIRVRELLEFILRYIKCVVEYNRLLRYADFALI